MTKFDPFYLTFTILCFVTLIFPLHGRSIRGINVDRFDPEEDWSQLDLKKQRLLAPYIMESIFHAKDKDRAGAFIQKTQNHQDQVLKTYSQIARIYFQFQTNQLRAVNLARLKKGKPAVARYLIDYYYGLETRRSTKMSSICRVPDHHILCQWYRFEISLEMINRSPKIQKGQIESLLFRGREFLRSGGSYVPFTSERLHKYCDYLYNLGLPLEAAIIAERFTYKNNIAKARKLRKKIPIYLAGAGDFHSALKFSFSIDKNDDRVLNNARLEWMILGGDYTRAINYLNTLTPEKLGSGRIANKRDPFTGFAYSRDTLRLRSAMLLYLNNDARTAAAALKRLTGIEGVIDGVPARYFARLRLAQILLEENSGLSHKIAEDLVYLAQAKGWDVLEYYATVLDAWALYYQKNYYKALINLIKARGILTPPNRRFYLHYTHTLGLLAVRQKMKPYGNYSALIYKISRKIRNEPENEAMLVIGNWAPRSAGREFFQQLAVQHWNQRRQYSQSIEFLAAYRDYQRSFFKVGHNPGGVRGYIHSSGWIKKMEEFSTTHLLASNLNLDKNSYLLSLSMLQKQKNDILRIKSLPLNQAYLFGFSLKDTWKMFLVYPSASRVYVGKRKGKKIFKIKNKPGFSHVRISKSQAHRLQDSCPATKESCNSGYLGVFRKVFNKSRVKRLNIMYNSKFNLNYPALVLGDRSDILPVYFNQTSIRNDTYSPIRPRIYMPKGCDSFINLSRKNEYHILSSFFFSDRKSGSVYIWPKKYDTQKSIQRPVYLRNFHCGTSHIRLWDMDRFSGNKSTGIVFYQARQADARIDDAFVEYFSDRNTALLEFPKAGNNRNYESWIASWKNKRKIQILDEYKSLWLSDKRVRLILPFLYVR